MTWYLKTNVMQRIKPPSITNFRGAYRVPEVEQYDKYSTEPLIQNPVNWNSIFDRLTAEYFPKKPYQTCQV